MKETAPRKIMGYSGPEMFQAHDIRHWVYHSQTAGSPVILMHELPGLTQKCRLLADRITSAGFRVYMPLLFGEPESTSYIKNTAYLCISHEFQAFAASQTQPIVSWLRELITYVAERESTAKVGVIGMCLTGNFALTLVSHVKVQASVCCQPSLPFFREDNLAISPDDLRAAVDAAQKLGKGSVIGFRYEQDWICPAAKFQQIREKFGESFDGEVFPGKGHATLTEHLHERALEKTLHYLKEKL